MEHMISRRMILKKTFGLMAISALGPVLGACQKACRKEESPTNAKEEADFSACESSSLSPDEKAIRNNLRYVDATPISTRTCDNCKLYTLPKAGAQCGGCRIIPGPVHPKGWCSSWYALM